jgi:hypothetical protein
MARRIRERERTGGPISTGRGSNAVARQTGCDAMALSRELNLAARNLEVLILAHAAVAARHVWNASSRRTRSVRREVRWRWTLKVFWTAAWNGQEALG